MQKRPHSAYLAFDEKIPDEKRVGQIIAWLQLPLAAEAAHHSFTIRMWTRGAHLRPRRSRDRRGRAASGRNDGKTFRRHRVTSSASGSSRSGRSRHGNHAGGWIVLDKWLTCHAIRYSKGLTANAPSEEDAEKAYKSLLGASETFRCRQAEVPGTLNFGSGRARGGQSS